MSEERKTKCDWPGCKEAHDRPGIEAGWLYVQVVGAGADEHRDYCHHHSLHMRDVLREMFRGPALHIPRRAPLVEPE